MQNNLDTSSKRNVRRTFRFFLQRNNQHDRAFIAFFHYICNHKIKVLAAQPCVALLNQFTALYGRWQWEIQKSQRYPT